MELFSVWIVSKPVCSSAASGQVQKYKKYFELDWEVGGVSSEPIFSKSSWVTLMNSRWGTSLAIPSTPEGIHEWQPKTRLTVLSARWWLVSHQGKAKSPCGAHHGKRPQALGVFFHFSSWFLCEVGIYYPHLTDKEIRLETQEPASQHITNKQPDWGCSWHQPSDGSWSGVSQHLLKKLCKHT